MAQKYSLKPPSADFLNELTKIVGPSNVLRGGDPNQSRYLKEWRDRYIGQSPLILRPSNSAEISSILKRCNEEYVGVVPQSGNTGLVGGQIPHENGTEIVISLDRMTKIKNLDLIGKSIEVEAGVTLAATQQAALSSGLLLPLSIASEGSACIGGNLATNVGGSSVIAYGSIRHLTLGLEVVLADGRIWSYLSDLTKDNSGYSLKDLFIGSEGTLGIITSAILKLINRPNGTATAFISLRSYDDILRLFNITTRFSGSNLTSFEFMSRDALLLSLKHSSIKTPLSDTSAPCYVLIELSTSETNYANTLLENLLSTSEANALMLEACLVSSLQQAANLWHLRENMSEAQKKEGGSIKHDISLPLKNIPEFLMKAAITVETICTGARPVPFGHIGDGNIHYNVSQPIGIDKTEFLKYENVITKAIHDLVCKMKGSISAEHGIGRAKKEELQRVKSQIDLDLMRSIKSALDPRCILNPGKLL